MKKRNDDSHVEETPSLWQERDGINTLDMDSFPPEYYDKIRKKIIRLSGQPLFDGSISHGYSKAFTGKTEKCPRCSSPTRQCTANFIYVTGTACRAMLVPAGFFCTACPTVIVDEQLISIAVKAGYRFRRVVGVDYLDKKDPDYFETWNGEKPIYILDEDQQFMDMVLDSEIRASVSQKQSTPRGSAKKNKVKRKQADQARRRNRKKKK